MSDRYDLLRRARLDLPPARADEPRILSIADYKRRREHAVFRRRWDGADWAPARRTRSRFLAAYVAIIAVLIGALTWWSFHP